ncbi:MAG: radical SAM protein [Candidatus Woykebacteria bacterium]
MGIFSVSGALRGTQFIATRGPRYGTLFVNTGCNRRCVYCVVPDEGSGIELPTETWFEIIDRLHSWGVRLFGILGGEPTLRKDLPEIVAYAAKRGGVNVTSNGDTFAGARGLVRLETLTGSGVKVLTLSLHQAEDLDRQLDLLVTARRLGAIPVLGVVVTRQSIGTTADVMRETNSRGILFRYCFVQSLGGVFSALDAQLQPTPGQIEDFTSQVLKQKKRTGLIQNSDLYIKGWDLYPRSWHCDVSTDRWVVVDNEGKLMACSEYATSVPVLSIQSLNDARWVEERTDKRSVCAGCTYQCYIEEEGLGTKDLVREGINIGRGLLRSKPH